MALMGSKTIVIGVPVHNEASYLAETIQSLKSQTFTDFTVLIGDNASTDETERVARVSIEGDDRFRYYRHDKNIGALANFEFILRQTESPFFMWLGGHDLISPEFLEKLLEAMLSDNSIVLSYSYIEMIDRDGKHIVNFGDKGSSKIRGNPMVRFIQAIRYAYGYQVNSVIRRDALENFIFSPIVIWDLVLISHLSFQGRFNCIPEKLFKFRDMHPQGSENSDSIMERIIGNVAPLADHNKTIAYYLSSFDRLSKKYITRNIYRHVLRALVIQRLMPNKTGIEPTLLRYAVRFKQLVLRNCGLALRD